MDSMSQKAGQPIAIAALATAMLLWEPPVRHATRFHQAAGAHAKKSTGTPDAARAWSQSRPAARSTGSGAGPSSRRRNHSSRGSSSRQLRSQALTLLFDPEHALDDRIAMEQFAIG